MYFVAPRNNFPASIWVHCKNLFSPQRTRRKFKDVLKLLIIHADIIFKIIGFLFLPGTACHIGFISRCNNLYTVESYINDNNHHNDRCQCPARCIPNKRLSSLKSQLGGYLRNNMKVQIDSYFKIEDTRIKLKHLYSILIENIQVRDVSGGIFFKLWSENSIQFLYWWNELYSGGILESNFNNLMWISRPLALQTYTKSLLWEIPVYSNL
jgi:hypothetical protein